eukprot:g10622.t1
MPLRAEGDDCRCHECKTCKSCDAGFRRKKVGKNHLCRANSCTCSDGKAVTGADCDKHKANKCASCDDGYELSSDSCSLRRHGGIWTWDPRTCTCSNGKGKTGSSCPKQGEEDCQSCTTTGYELTTKNGRSVCTDPIAVMQAVLAKKQSEERTAVAWGDPHVKVFDYKYSSKDTWQQQEDRFTNFHQGWGHSNLNTMEPGTYWLVKTPDNLVSIQGVYGWGWRAVIRHGKREPEKGVYYQYAGEKRKQIMSYSGKFEWNNNRKDVNIKYHKTKEGLVSKKRLWRVKMTLPLFQELIINIYKHHVDVVVTMRPIDGMWGDMGNSNGDSGQIGDHGTENAHDCTPAEKSAAQKLCHEMFKVNNSVQECVVDVCQQGPRMAEQAEIVEDEVEESEEEESAVHYQIYAGGRLYHSCFHAEEHFTQVAAMPRDEREACRTLLGGRCAGDKWVYLDGTRVPEAVISSSCTNGQLLCVQGGTVSACDGAQKIACQIPRLYTCKADVTLEDWNSAFGFVAELSPLCQEPKSLEKDAHCEVTCSIVHCLPLRREPHMHMLEELLTACPGGMQPAEPKSVRDLAAAQDAMDSESCTTKQAWTGHLADLCSKGNKKMTRGKDVSLPPTFWRRGYSRGPNEQPQCFEEGKTTTQTCDNEPKRTINHLDAQKKILIALPNVCEKKNMSFKRTLELIDSLKSFGGEHPELKVLDWLGIPASDDGSRPPESVEEASSGLLSGVLKRILRLPDLMLEESDALRLEGGLAPAVRSGDSGDSGANRPPLEELLQLTTAGASSQHAHGGLCTAYGPRVSNQDSYICCAEWGSIAKSPASLFAAIFVEVDEQLHKSLDAAAERCGSTCALCLSWPVGGAYRILLANLGDSRDVIVLATDGVLDVLSSSQVANFAVRGLAAGAVEAAADVVWEALQAQTQEGLFSGAGLCRSGTVTWVGHFMVLRMKSGEVKSGGQCIKELGDILSEMIRDGKVPKEDLSFEVLQELCGMTLDWRTDPADHIFGFADQYAWISKSTHSRTCGEKLTKDAAKLCEGKSLESLLPLLKSSVKMSYTSLAELLAAKAEPFLATGSEAVAELLEA